MAERRYVGDMHPGYQGVYVCVCERERERERERDRQTDRQTRQTEKDEREKSAFDPGTAPPNAELCMPLFGDACPGYQGVRTRERPGAGPHYP